MPPVFAKHQCDNKFVAFELLILGSVFLIIDQIYSEDRDANLGLWLSHLSGHGPDKPGGGQMYGHLGKDVTIEEGQMAARLTGISMLSTLKSYVGDLNKVKRIVKVLGLVNSEPNFTAQPQVMNGFSNLMVEVFGERGKHARSALGVAALPNNISVEIEMIVELK